MIDYPELPDELNRKLNPITRTPEELRAAKAAMRPTEIVVPPVRKHKKPPKVQPLNGLTAGERDELTEIKLMVGTSIDHATRMASDWISRAPDRIVQARRRLALHTVKGLKSRGRIK
jgi:hypothetical protein